MIAEIKQKCKDNLAAGVDTIDLVINRDREEAEYLAPGKKGPRGEVLVPFIKGGVQRGYVVNFQIEELLEYLDGQR